MGWNDLVNNFLFNSVASPWIQLCMAVVILIVIALARRLSAEDVLIAEMIICFIWMPLSMLISLWTEVYWAYLLNWILVTICFFGLCHFILSFCEKYGRPDKSDAGLLLFLPVYLFPITILASLVIRTAIYVFKWVYILIQ